MSILFLEQKQIIQLMRPAAVVDAVMQASDSLNEYIFTAQSR